MNRGKVQRRALAVAVGVTSGIMSVAGLAWACTPQATAQSINPGAAPPGAEVTLTSENGYPSAAPVEIRWNSSEGPLLATAAGSGSFSVRFTVPDVHPDIYYVVGVQRSGGVITHKAVVSFEVTPAGSTASPPARSGTGSTGTGQGGSTSNQTAGGVAGTAGSSAEQQGATATPGSGPAFPAEAGANATASPSPVAATAAAETAATSARSATASAQATSPAAGPAASGTTAGQGVTAPADDRERAPVGAEVAASPSVNSVSGDLWGGFSGGAADRASLAPDQPVHSSGTSPVAVGAALMSGGLVMLFAGFMVAEARRRRVGVAASSGGGPRR